MLLAKGLINSYPLSTGRSRINLLRLTEQGKAALGITEPDADRLGGPDHRYWKRRLAEHLRVNGYGVTQEYPVGGGRTIDLLAVRGGKRIAFEVETGKSDAEGNVRKCLAAWADKVIVVATSEKARDHLAASVPSSRNLEILTGSQALQQSNW